MNDLEIVGKGILKLDDIKADKTEMSKYALKTEIPKNQDLSEYAKKTDLDLKTDKTEMSKYALKTDIPQGQDLSVYAKKTDLDLKADKSTTYTKTETDKKISEITFEKDTLESNTRTKIQSLIGGV